ncbi:Phospho-2-dehydro-3-deoxyheptonate aldolase, Phe-sensitive [Serratia fonticola]|uniref:Phospho-2-dehydro-3-deoxyheptonate aldolase, Trp-sensitive n=1 Tax=Serratia fonticola TaxID=47917 RepID=A0A4U9V8J0_SERFO|nr:Phospho-2-dehydro-3-deoxyheptonate aldolase, Phe-sensitive [Serratia fonticola]
MWLPPVIACASFDLPEQLVIDFSHGNCQKLHRRQLEVAENVCQQIRAGSVAVAGVMAKASWWKARRRSWLANH